MDASIDRLLETAERIERSDTVKRISVPIPKTFGERMAHRQDLGLPAELSEGRTLLYLADVGLRVLDEAREAKQALALFQSYGEDPDELAEAEANEVRARLNGSL